MVVVVGIWLVLERMLVLLLRGGSLSGICRIKMVGGRGRMKVVLGVDKSSELVCKIFVVSVHVHRPWLSARLAVGRPLNQMIKLNIYPRYK